MHSSSDPCDNRVLRSQARRLIDEFTCVFRARPHYPLYQLQVDPLTGDFFVRVQPPEACVRTLVERRDGAEGAHLASRSASPQSPRDCEIMVDTVDFCYFFVDLADSISVKTLPAACAEVLGESLVEFGGLTSASFAADPFDQIPIAATDTTTAEGRHTPTFTQSEC